MDKVVVLPDEVVAPPADSSAPPPPVHRIRLYMRILVALLALVQPLLLLVSLCIYLYLRLRRSANALLRLAWANYLLLVNLASALLVLVTVGVYLCTSPLPSTTSNGLSELDERVDFSILPAPSPLTPIEASAQLKPLVFVVSPASRNWITHTVAPSHAMGAGVLLAATGKGYLVATARHVLDAPDDPRHAPPVLLASASGTWAEARVIAVHRSLDLVLLWLPRSNGSAAFTLPVVRSQVLADGAPVYVIGHPQGLRFTLSTGIISRRDGTMLQISAPVSPGNSGGPLFDQQGRLAGIVLAMVDKNFNPNAENLNFAVRADAFLDTSGWFFAPQSDHFIADFIHAQPK